MKGRFEIGVPALTALAAGVCAFLVVPLQSYLANRGSFEFGLGRFWAEAVPVFLAATVALFAVLAVLGRRFGRLPALLTLFLALAVLLEAGPLSIGLPEFDGRIGIYKSHARQCWDLAVWIVLITVPVVFRRRLREHVPVVAAAVLAYAAAAVFDIRVDDEGRTFSKEDGYLIESMMAQPDVVASVRYSPKRNVFLLIVDSMPVHVAERILKGNPAIADRFAGFVDYTDNVGMHWPTRRAIPGMFTGKYYETTRDMISYGHSYMKHGSILEDYLAADVPVFMNLDMGFGGYTNRRDAPDDHVVSLRMTGALAWSVGEISVFRAIPYVAKRHYLRQVMHGWRRTGADGWYGADRKMWPALSACPLKPEWDLTLQIHHTWGVHPPVKGGFVKVGAEIFGMIGGFLDALREKGIYDSATILLTADHGVTTGVSPRPHPEIDEHAFPFLMVKPAGAKGPLAYSDAPTTHAGIAEALRALRTADLDRDALEALLCRKERLIRDGRKGSLTDWTLHADGSFDVRTYPENEKE